MGTCHTAAVAIAQNMKMLFKKIKIRAELSSEFSAFNISDDMTSTLVIAIAQSGTTIDTNVALKLAKDNGAYTLTLLNKRQGDISFIAHTTIYLGNGRDIEIAVPSTKTYICHILVGHILTYYLYSKTYNKNILSGELL